MAPDLLSTIRGELEERMATLRPLLDEYHRLLTAADTLAAVEAEAAAAEGAAAEGAANAKRAARARTVPGADTAPGEPDATGTPRAPRTSVGGRGRRRSADGRRSADEVGGTADGLGETPTVFGVQAASAVGPASVRTTSTPGIRRGRAPRGSAAGAIALAASPRDAIEQAASLAEAIRQVAPRRGAVERAPSSIGRNATQDAAIKRNRSAADATERNASPTDAIEPPTMRSTAAARPRGRKTAPREAEQEAILAALEHGSHTPGELAMVTALSAAGVRTNLSRLLARGAVTRVRREGKAAYALAPVSARA